MSNNSFSDDAVARGLRSTISRRTSPALEGIYREIRKTRFWTSMISWIGILGTVLLLMMILVGQGRLMAEDGLTSLECLQLATFLGLPLLLLGLPTVSLFRYSRATRRFLRANCNEELADVASGFRRFIISACVGAVGFVFLSIVSLIVTFMAERMLL